MLRLAISSAVLRPFDDITITVSRREENKTSDFSYMGIFCLEHNRYHTRVDKLH